MKLIKSAILICGCFLGALIIDSCIMSPGCKSGGYHYDYSIENMKLKVNELRNYDFGTDFASSPAFRDDFGLDILFEVFITNRKMAVKQNVSLFPTMYADDCSDYYHAKDSIIGISITADVNFGELFEAGDDISELFRVVDYNGRDFKLIPIAEYLQQLVRSVYDYYDIGITSVLLDDPCVEAGEYVFTVTATLSDGRELTDTLEAIIPLRD